MKENSEMKEKIFALEQEINKSRGDTLEKHANISMIRETEHKVFFQILFLSKFSLF